MTKHRGAWHLSFALAILLGLAGALALTMIGGGTADAKSEDFKQCARATHYSGPFSADGQNWWYFYASTGPIGHPDYDCTMFYAQIYNDARSEGDGSPGNCYLSPATHLDDDISYSGLAQASVEILSSQLLGHQCTHHQVDWVYSANPAFNGMAETAIWP